MTSLWATSDVITAAKLNKSFNSGLDSAKGIPTVIGECYLAIDSMALYISLDGSTWGDIIYFSPNPGTLYNTFIGFVAGYNDTTGYENTFVGYGSASVNTTGYDNTFLGYKSGVNNVEGHDNVYLGSNAGYSASSILANWNVFVGSGAGYSDISGDHNTFMGYQAGYSNNGDNNTFIGADAGYYISTTSFNIMIGYEAGKFLGSYSPNTNAGYSIYIGCQAKASVDGVFNEIAIGSYSVGGGNNTWIIGVIGVKQAIKEGANAAMGASILVAGTVTVSNTFVTANSRIFLTNQLVGGTVGILSIGTRVAGTSFVINSSSATDTSKIAWEIKEPC